MNENARAEFGTAVMKILVMLLTLVFEAGFIWFVWPFVMVPIFALPVISFLQALCLLLIVDTLVHAGYSNRDKSKDE